MPDSGVLETEDRFFEALRRGDHDAVAQVLSDDFVIVDIRAGAAVPREGFLGPSRAETSASRRSSRASGACADTARWPSSSDARRCAEASAVRRSKRRAATNTS